MYLWNINLLVEKLKTNTLSEKKAYFFYILTPALSFGTGTFFSLLLFSHQFIEEFFTDFLQLKDANIALYNWIGFVSGILTILITSTGLLLCYWTNKKGDGQQFAKRMACLSFTINFHLTVYILAFITLLIGFGYFLILGKISLFKKEVLFLVKSQATLGETLQEALQQTPFREFVGKTVTQSKGVFGTLLSAPVLLLKLPSLPGKISAFVSNIRGSVLIAYPIIAILPPMLSLSHYFLLRKFIAKVAYK